MVEPFSFGNLSERHPGLTTAIGDSFEKAARVCLGRRHGPPARIVLRDNGQRHERQADWREADDREKVAWANEIDATEAGAYALALAAMDALRGLVAVARAETLTGADYYLGLVDAHIEDLDAAIRLEISGTNSAGTGVIARRLSRKKAQLKSGIGNLPAVVSIVSFGLPQVLSVDVF